MSSNMVLIVDDDTDSRAVTKELVENMGYQTCEAYDGIHAIVLLEEMNDVPTVTLLDVNMPEVDGLRVIKHIRNLQRFDCMPIVLVTALQTSKSVQQAVTKGADDYIFKPFDHDRFRQIIQRWIDLPIVSNHWRDLSSLQSKALRATAAALSLTRQKGIANETLSFEAIRESCAIMVHAVENKETDRILTALRTHDGYSFVHSLRVGIYLARFAWEQNYRGDDFLSIVSGGVIHDLGKCKTPNHILNKPGPLTKNEWSIMREHPLHTERMLKEAGDVPPEIIAIGSQHHEKMDGTGYPYGLKGDKLSELARMTAIADAFGALTDKRSYKDPVPFEKAFEMLLQPVGHLDPRLVGIFRNIMLS